MDRANGGGPAAAASRAERFDDEKRRIVDSCFSKRDPDGSPQETYITHIRITEYSTYPASPPPPQARTPATQKPRVIVIAVRKSGRVRVHKSKENPNGTFSIGKTWNLDDLARIESFTGPNVPWDQKEWAGGAGFIVLLGKPYFWEAQAEKEKKFFIASLIKIYGKYTNGNVPELVGFDQKELDQVLGAGKRPANAPPPPQPQQQPQPPAPPPILQQPRPPPMQAQPRPTDTLEQRPSGQSNYSGSAAPSPAPPASDPLATRFQRAQGPGGGPMGGVPSPAGSFDSTTSRDRTGIRKGNAFNKSQESVAASFATRSEDASSIPPRSRNGMNGPGAFGRFGDTPPEPMAPPTQPLPQPPTSRSTPTPPQQLSRPSTATNDDQVPPERRRPPMDPVRPLDRDLVPRPLAAPKRSGDPVAPPPRSTERMSPRKETSAAASLDASASPVPPAMGSLEPKSPERTAREPPVPAPAPVPEPAPPAAAPVEAPEPAETPQSPPAPADAEEARPGLGPMIKANRSKGELAGMFRKAASAAATANAFKPRPGGAGERLRQLAEQAKATNEPDGITGVVPAPPRPPSRNEKETPAPAAAPSPEPVVPPKAAARTSLVPEVRISVPNSSRPNSQSGPKEVTPAATPEPEKPKPAEPEKPKRSVVAGNDAKYLQHLGIDPNILDHKSDEVGTWLDALGWVPGRQMQARGLDEIKVDLERELHKTQAGGWLARFQEEDERVGAIKRGIDASIAECDEMDNLLTLYSVELSTLSEDIAYIEAQGQGLQVQTANQKLLKKELESLLETCAITSTDLDVLRIAPLDNIRGLEDVESSLVTLYKAMMKIDPKTLGGPDGADDKAGGMMAVLDTDQPSGLSSSYGHMRIVQEKKEMYTQESLLFMGRLQEFMTSQFDAAAAETRRALEGALSKKVDASHHEAGRDVLWRYSPLMLYARDADRASWSGLMEAYQGRQTPVYKAEFQAAVAAWRRAARRMTGEEAELLFTSQADNKQDNVAQAARKLTVKRSQTLARALRSPLADGGSTKAEREKSGGDTRSFPYEVFAGVLDDLLPLVEMEQNFIIDFFHATTLEQADFPDAVGASKPRDRRGGDLRRRRLMEPDRDLARRVTRAMEVIFAFVDQEFTRLMEWVLGQDALQGIGVLVTVEKKMAEIAQSNQDFLNTIFQKLHGLLGGRFRKFVDDQIRAIEETKVKINKRKGVIHFIRVFPNFSTAVENMLAGVDPTLAIRRTVDREYDRMLKSMFESLMVIARENPGASAGGTGPAAAAAADPEDKEALNFHILLIENMNHFAEETDTRELEVLEVWKDNARAEYADHMGLYLAAVMRRPLGRLLDYLENIEAQRQSGRPATSIAAQPSNSRSVFNKVLATYDAREVRKGIDALRKRVEKHFGDADDPALSRDLVLKVTRECERFYTDVEARIERVVRDVYGGDVLFEWPRADVKAAFR